MWLIYYYNRGLVIDSVYTKDPKTIFRCRNSDKNPPVEYVLECHVTSSEGKKFHTSAHAYDVVEQHGDVLSVKRIKGDGVPYYIREEMYDPSGIRGQIKAMTESEVQK